MPLAGLVERIILARTYRPNAAAVPLILFIGHILRFLSTVEPELAWSSVPSLA